MKLKELQKKGENLREQGKEAERQIEIAENNVRSVRAQLQSAQSALDAAQETDEDGNPKGNVAYARAAVTAAQAMLDAAESDLRRAEGELDRINEQKEETISEIDAYTAAEEQNLEAIRQLQGMRHGDAVDAFISGLVERMNAGQQSKGMLEESMGRGSTARHYTAGTALTKEEFLSGLFGPRTGGGFSSGGAYRAKRTPQPGAAQTDTKESPAPQTDTNESLAAQAVRQGAAQSADFGKLDVRTSREILSTIQKTKQMFPDLEMGFIGSLQARNERMRRQLEVKLRAEYAHRYPGIPLSDLEDRVQQEVDRAMRDFENFDKDTIAISLSYLPGYRPAGDPRFDHRGISINERYGGNYDFFLSVRQQNVACGFKPQGCATPKATVDHELGHQIDSLVGAEYDPEIIGEYLKFMKLPDEERRAALSGYAATNINEFIAEAWSERMNNPQCRAVAKRVSDRILKLNKDRKKT